MPRHGYRVGVPRRCRYLEVLNTDAREYGGSGMGNYGSAAVEAIPSHGFDQSIVLTLPPLSALWLVPELDEDPDAAEHEAASAIEPAVAKLVAPPVARAATDEDKAVSTERNTGSMPPRRRR